MKFIMHFRGGSKRNEPQVACVMKTIAPMMVANSGIGHMTTRDWDRVTCPDCLPMKPPRRTAQNLGQFDAFVWMPVDGSYPAEPTEFVP